MNRCTFIAPVFNEEASVPALFERFGELAKRLEPCRVAFVVVDDGSTDATAERLLAAGQALGVRLLRHDRNRGPGHAFGTAFESLADGLRPDDYVATIEGDNTSPIDTLLRMLGRAEGEGLDLVLGSPHAPGGSLGGTSLWRRFLSAGANGAVRCLLGMRGVRTISSFCRVWRGRALRALQERYGPRIIERPGFDGVVEMLKKAMILGLRIGEEPLVLDTSARVGKSKMRVLRTIRGYLGLWLALPRWKRQADVPRPGSRSKISEE